MSPRFRKPRNPRTVLLGMEPGALTRDTAPRMGGCGCAGCRAERKKWPCCSTGRCGCGGGVRGETAAPRWKTAAQRDPLRAPPFAYPARGDEPTPAVWGFRPAASALRPTADFTNRSRRRAGGTGGGTAPLGGPGTGRALLGKVTRGGTRRCDTVVLPTDLRGPEGCPLEDVSAECPPPCIAQTAFPLDSLDLTALGRAARLESDGTEAEDRLLQEAWALLALEIDMVRWAACWADGDPNGLPDRLEDNILGRDPRRIRLQLRSSFERNGELCDFAFRSFSVRGRLRICRESSPWSRYVNARSRGGDAAACSIIDLAGTLMHELIHLSGRVIHESDGECALTFRAENIFRWLIYHKYRRAAASLCCNVTPGTEDHNDLWNSDMSVFITADCL